MGSLRGASNLEEADNVEFLEAEERQRYQHSLDGPLRRNKYFEKHADTLFGQQLSL